MTRPGLRAGPSENSWTLQTLRINEHFQVWSCQKDFFLLLLFLLPPSKSDSGSPTAWCPILTKQPLPGSPSPSSSLSFIPLPPGPLTKNQTIHISTLATTSSDSGQTNRFQYCSEVPSANTMLLYCYCQTKVMLGIMPVRGKTFIALYHSQILWKSDDNHSTQSVPIIHSPTYLRSKGKSDGFPWFLINCKLLDQQHETKCCGVL